MVKVNFYDSVPDEKLAFAVIAAKKDGKWIFCQHKARSTWEFPGGHREAGETIEEAAARELYEETGATAYDLSPVCVYSVKKDEEEESFGMLFTAQVYALEEMLTSEIARIRITEILPENWTYPLIQPELLKKILKTEESIPMTEEEKLLSGVLFCPGDPALKAIKLKSHNLCYEYNKTFEDETEKRREIVQQIFGALGENSFLQGPIYIHYGTHTKIGNRFFGNFNLTIQDDAEVTIGDDCNFGPGVTIVTPCHPMLPDERKRMLTPEGEVKRLCYAKPVHIGNDCWFGANVTVCPGVTIGDNCVIGAGAVVTRDIPANSFAAGNPCRVIREITEADSMMNKPEYLGGCTRCEE